MVSDDERLSGRAASAHILDRLRSAVLSGRPKTYEELAQEAKCTTRTVRNYLNQAERLLATKITRVRGTDGLVRVRAVPTAEEPARISDLAQILAREMLKNLFPIEGTDLDVRKKSGVEVVVAARGAYEYGEQHLKALRGWLVAASRRPRRAVRFDYDSIASSSGARDGAPRFSPRIVWPLGIVVRDLARVYLAGLPEDAFGAKDVRTYCLERVDCAKKGGAFATMEGAEAAPPPDGIDEAIIDNAIDLPFSIFPARPENQVMVEVRFDAARARHVLGRRWHKHQRFTTKKDGSVELKFGPADPGEAAAWVRQWGEGVTVLGDAKLKAALAEKKRR